MAECVNVAVDAMGGDNAPTEIVKGAVEAVNADKRVKVFLVGKEPVIREELKAYTYDAEQLEVVHAEEVIETAEPPVMAIRRKKDSSIVKAMYMVKNGECDAFVSAGSTGAVLVGGQVIVGRIRGVERPPLAPLIPTENGVSLLLDCGANVDARPSMLVQFAKMGSVYMESVMGVKNPKVGIVNIGAEEEKGNALVKETFPLLKNCPEINFIGSVEARDIPAGVADVIVCEAFVGNVVLKMYEGVSSALLHQVKQGMMSTLRSKIGALLVKPALKKTLKSFDTSQYGGAPLLGLNGLVVKTHGSSKAVEVKNSILQCIAFKEEKINEKIKEQIGLEDKADVYPSTLSGGQKQRLTIARALVSKPDILILDDSLSALDFATDAALRKAIGELEGNVTTFLVSQRISGIRQADKILVMDDGELAGQGTHEELMETCETYQEIYYSQFPEERPVVMKTSEKTEKGAAE